jgi:CRISPR system Cascade subunit CasE
LANPYQLHSTLCRAFSPPEKKCPTGAFLWRLEPELDSRGAPRILIQSNAPPDWSNLTPNGWLAEADTTIDLKERLQLDSLTAGQRFRFRLRANPCVTRNGKRLGLLKLEDQEAWLERKGESHGFSLPKVQSFDFSEMSISRIDVSASHAEMLRDKQRSDDSICIFSILFDGFLTVSEPDRFKKALQKGIGHGKVMGLGLLSVAPIT